MGWKSRKGATSLEYGILAALIAVVMMVTLPLVIEEPMCRLIDVGCVIETRMTLEPTFLGLGRVEDLV